MISMIEVFTAAEESHVVNELAFGLHPFMFGLIAFVILMLLTYVTFMFRRTAVSHPKESEVSPYVPYVHPGHAARD